MSEPGDTEQQIRQDRLAKLAAARSRGVDPYPTDFPHRVLIAVLRERFGELEPGTDSGQRLRVAGRVMARRGHGKAQFLDLVDASGRIQLHATADATPGYEEFGELDLGDLIGVEGEVFQSRRGELSVRVESWQLLAKCLRPLPEKWHGLTDVEQRYRHRYVDLITNEQSRADAIARSRAVTAMRAALDEEGFVEVETPVLQPLYGGGAAKPFTTHSNELERDLYLRIADELYLKRLIVGGLDRVYELSKDFRNESISFKHSPEFTMLEWYQAYADYRDGMSLVEKVVSRAGAAAGSTLDLSPPWPRRYAARGDHRGGRHRPAGRPRPRPAGLVHAGAGHGHLRRPHLGAGGRPPAVALRRVAGDDAAVHHRLPGGAVAVLETLGCRSHDR